MPSLGMQDKAAKVNDKFGPNRLRLLGLPETPVLKPWWVFGFRGIQTGSWVGYCLKFQLDAA